MKKVFLKRTGKSGFLFTEGKEYLLAEDGRVVADDGNLWAAGGPWWQKIERDCFGAYGHEWFKCTCDEKAWPPAGAIVFLLFGDGFQLRHEVGKIRADRAGAFPHGWRFADSAKPEQADRPITSIIKRVCAEYSEDESERNDQYQDFAWLEFLMLAAPDVAAVEDTSLPPRIRRIVNEKEDAQAAKQQLAKDAQDKALQERAEQLSDAGKAMDRVNQDHGHKLGLASWMK